MRLARPDPDYIRQLEAQATRNPNAYRIKVIALALWGDITLTAAQLLPIVLPIGLVLFVLNAALVSGSLAFLNGTGIVATVLLVWLTRPMHRFDGSEVTRRDAADFFDVMDTLRRTLSVKPRMRVMLDDEFNASAAETRGILGLLGQQHIMTLGIPLLCVLTREQMLSVIGHELGHFSRRHGRFGHWLYRARGGWMLYAQDVTESDALYERAAAAFAERFVPYFSAYSFVLARQCEYEADADAASATSAQAMAQALTRVNVYGRLWHGGFRRETNRWRLAEAQAPSDYLDRFMRTYPQWPAVELEAWLKQALAALPNWIDTHPRLRERVGALKQPPDPGNVREPCAGEALFGAAWPAITQQFNQRWRKRVQRKWLFYHLYRNKLLQPLVGASDQQMASWPLSTCLLHAEAIMDDGPEQGMMALAALAERHAGDAQVLFRAGLAHSEREPKRAIALLQRAAAVDPGYRLQSFRGLRDIHEAIGNGKEADRYAARVDLALKHSARAYAVLDSALVKGDVSVSPLQHGETSLIARAAAADDCVQEIWLFARDVPVPLRNSPGEERMVNYSLHFGLWVIDPEILRRSGENEDDVFERYTGYLQTLLPSHAVVTGKAVYTTESRERWMLDLMSRFQQACCYRRS